VFVLAVTLTGGKTVMMVLAGFWKECVVAYFLYVFTTLVWKYCVYMVLFLFNNVIYVFLLL
jgi:hypothetical protein